MWCKWKHKFAEGAAKEWTWFYLGKQPPHSDDALPLLEAWEKFIREEQVPIWRDQYAWSAHYRGVEFEVVEVPPREIVLRHMQRHQEIARKNSAIAAELGELLQEKDNDA